MLNILCVAFMKKSILMDIHIIEYGRSLVKSLAIMYMENYKKIHFYPIMEINLNLSRLNFYNRKIILHK